MDIFHLTQSRDGKVGQQAVLLHCAVRDGSQGFRVEREFFWHLKEDLSVGSASSGRN